MVHDAGNAVGQANCVRCTRSIVICTLSLERYHVDMFAVTEAVYLDAERIYRDGAWLV